MNDPKAIAFIRDGAEHWWYVGRRAVASTVFDKICAGTILENALEIGAGYGAMTSILTQRCTTVDVAEPLTDTHQILSAMPGVRKIIPDLELPTPPLDIRYQSVCMFDVLEHIEHDEEALRSIADSLLDKNGILLLTVPAYQWMWSRHDADNSHFRRYSLGKLKKVLLKAGFSVICSSYYMSTLFPLAVMARFAGLSTAGTTMPPKPINRLFSVIGRLESYIVRFLSIPFGLSIIIAARKNQPTSDLSRKCMSHEKTN